ncbi:TetR/AcrR family transcriptional regulator [Amycolatopsis sp. 195334CR]|uniref:TetR/AcrR family transcriptional regulator n=1 Tax=Amycolatopsis sp. 195334CR TaxID=2814588 RepID=UPI001F5D88D1|nr:TetR/AcrR family transcriptional regulator [Amycolatopsis sp. 195334CR]
MTATRMAKADRRRFLLDRAFELSGARGTAALTLVTLAEAAGVTRPVVYEHFGTREGLLMAMYRDFDQRLIERMRAAVAGASLEEVARGLATAYVDAVLAEGAGCAEVGAALAATEETRAFRDESQAVYLDEFERAFRPHAELSRRRDRAALIAIHSALDGLAAAALAGRISRAKAVSTAVAVVLGVLPQ